MCGAIGAHAKGGPGAVDHGHIGRGRAGDLGTEDVTVVAGDHDRTVHPRGITDRGVLAPGMAADLLLIDRDRLSTPDAPRYVRDFPADSGRFVVDADGYRAVVVNGEMLRDYGKWTGAMPGRVLRG